MERCILGSSRYGAWIDVEKKHHKVFIYQKLLFTLWCQTIVKYYFSVEHGYSSLY